ncbi:uncharacterized protein M6B38_152625 [Iris pallida]|uniref:Uncharacterized protein n=1 Tax=Iris pallida TaxID=29817 RepID=A0AAX6F5F7_IRIPA|nr:uncharacterized protein M6B38_152625 [Iris pallida]
MLGCTKKSSGDDRFYDAAKARRSSQRQRSAAAAAAPPEKIDGSEDPAKATTAPAAVSSSNLHRFLESTTPSVPAQYFSKMRMRGWRSCDTEQRPYFLLADLWESFKEWSAYGAGVPLVLNGSDCVVQYYVPYLSGIELYGHSVARHGTSRRQLGEDSDGDCFRDSSSDGSSDCELDSSLKYASDWGRNRIVNTSTIGMDRLCLREDHVSLQEGFSSDDSDSGNSQGRLLFQHLERNPPYSREPLADKANL